nr:odorant binding protein 2 [Monochamus saltuarius]
MGNHIFLVIVSAIFAASMVQATLDQSEYGSQIQAIKDNVHKICVSKSGTNEAAISNAANGIFTDEPTIKNYMKCILAEAKVMNEKGEFNVDAITQLLPENLREEGLTVIKGCIAEFTDIPNVDNKVFAFFKCYHKRNPNVYIFI